MVLVGMDEMIDGLSKAEEVRMEVSLGVRRHHLGTSNGFYLYPRPSLSRWSCAILDPSNLLQPSIDRGLQDEGVRMRMEKRLSGQVVDRKRDG